MRPTSATPSRHETTLLPGETPAVTCPASPAARRIAKRIGIIGVAFFLLKGILWLVIPIWFVGKGCSS